MNSRYNCKSTGCNLLSSARRNNDNDGRESQSSTDGTATGLPTIEMILCLVVMFFVLSLATIIVINTLKAMCNNMRELCLELVDSFELRFSFSTRNRLGVPNTSFDSDLEGQNIARPQTTRTRTSDEVREHSD